jgi:hypothetical protein
MKRIVTTLAILAVAAITYAADAHEMSKHRTPDAAKQTTTTVVGEIVDAGCYLGHAARGADHVDCAKQCILGGMPMCILTGEGVVYLLTMNHDNPDPYNKLKAMAGKRVSVTGVQMSRGGMKAIDVGSIRAMASKPTSQPGRAS